MRSFIFSLWSYCLPPAYFVNSQVWQPTALQLSVFCIIFSFSYNAKIANNFLQFQTEMWSQRLALRLDREKWHDFISRVNSLCRYGIFFFLHFRLNTRAYISTPRPAILLQEIFCGCNEVKTYQCESVKIIQYIL